MASYFLNSAKHLTLLESDADLVGLASPSDVADELISNEIDQLNSDPSL